jgi:hypothetical protein
LRVRGKEQIGLKGDQFSPQSRCALPMVPEISIVNNQVLPLDPAVIAQALMPDFEDLQIFKSAK